MEYQIVRSNRKTLAIQINQDAELIVKAPYRYSESDIEAFLMQKKEWIFKHTNRLKKQKSKSLSYARNLTEKEIRKYKEIARERFCEKAKRYAEKMGVSFHSVTIKEQKTRWGSCSSLKNLNFNWRLIFAPEEVQDYVIIHELAHLIEMNHSPAFWNIVEDTMKNYKVYKKWLNEHGHTLWY